MISTQKKEACVSRSENKEYYVDNDGYRYIKIKGPKSGPKSGPICAKLTNERKIIDNFSYPVYKEKDGKEQDKDVFVRIDIELKKLVRALPRMNPPKDKPTKKQRWKGGEVLPQKYLNP